MNKNRISSKRGKGEGDRRIQGHRSQVHRLNVSNPTGLRFAAVDTPDPILALAVGGYPLDAVECDFFRLRFM